MIVCGIDPGKSGAVVFLENKKIIYQTKMPVIGKEINCIRIYDLIKSYKPSHIYVEHSQAIPRTFSTSSAFSFGMSFGIIIGIVSVVLIPFTLVKPKVWQKTMWQGTSTDIKPKERSLVASMRLFPDHNFVLEGCKKPHDGIIDAALIALWGAARNSQSI